jgi:hypothetical protein
MNKNEETSFYNFSGSSPTSFLEQCFPNEDRVIVLAIDTTGTREDLLFSFGVKNLNDSRFQNILSSFEKDGYELSFYLESYDHYFGKSEMGLPLRE